MTDRFASINRAELLGRIKDDPVLRVTPGEKDVVNLILLTDETYRDRRTNQERRRVERHRLVFWDALARRAKDELRAGSEVAVEGRLQTREWTSQRNERRVTTEIVVICLHVLGREARVSLSEEDAHSTIYTSREV